MLFKEGGQPLLDKCEEAVQKERLFNRFSIWKDETTQQFVCQEEGKPENMERRPC